MDGKLVEVKVAGRLITVLVLPGAPSMLPGLEPGELDDDLDLDLMDDVLGPVDVYAAVYG